MHERIGHNYIGHNAVGHNYITKHDWTEDHTCSPLARRTKVRTRRRGVTYRTRVACMDRLCIDVCVDMRTDVYMGTGVFAAAGPYLACVALNVASVWIVAC